MGQRAGDDTGRGGKWREANMAPLCHVFKLHKDPIKSHSSKYPLEGGKGVGGTKSCQGAGVREQRGGKGPCGKGVKTTGFETQEASVLFPFLPLTS